MEYLPVLLDIALVLIPLASIVIGASRGFTKTVLPFALTIFFLLAARGYASPAAKRINSEFVHSRVESYIEERLENAAEDGVSTIENALPESFVTLAEKAGFTAGEAIKEDRIEIVSSQITSAAEKNLIIPALTFGVYVLFYIFSKILALIITGVVDIAAKLPVLKQANSLLGLVFGAVFGAVRCALFTGISALVCSFLPGSAYATAVSQTKLLSPLIEYISSLI